MDADERQQQTGGAVPKGAPRRQWNLRMTPRRFVVWACLLAGAYGLGLTRDIAEPWYGVHDWNGAFFSQLARNFLRYPWSVHHGMPIVAAGAAIPGPEDSSIYATHPPALVWMVAGAFRIFGESEWAARLVPILFSLGTFALLLWLTSKAHGWRVAALAGLFYAAMPMSVYFGRMVDHEAVCLFCMVAAAAGWVLVQRGGARRGWGLAIVLAALWLGIWVDWVVVIFGGLMTAWMGLLALRRRGRWGDFALLGIGGLVAIGSMVSFIVYAGLGGRWGDLVAIFLSRAEAHADIKGAGTAGVWWWHLSDNVTWLLGLFAIAGIVVSMVRCRTGGLFPTPGRGGAPVDSAATPATAGLPGGASGESFVISGRGGVSGAATAARAGLNLIAVTAVLWLVVFWKQFERHEYWMFYTGPAIAIFAAIGILTLVDIARRARATASVLALAVLVPVAVMIEVHFRNELFAHIHQVPPQAIQDWEAINNMTAPADRVAMYDDPYRVERRGNYVFRNIVPPHIAWYMDRRMRVVSDVSKLPQAARDCAVFIIGSREAALIRDREGPVLERWKLTPLIGQLVVDLRTPTGAVSQPTTEALD